MKIYYYTVGKLFENNYFEDGAYFIAVSADNSTDAKKYVNDYAEKVFGERVLIHEKVWSWNIKSYKLYNFKYIYDCIFHIMLNDYIEFHNKENTITERDKVYNDFKKKYPIIRLIDSVNIETIENINSL